MFQRIIADPPPGFVAMPLKAAVPGLTGR